MSPLGLHKLWYLEGIVYFYGSESLEFVTNLVEKNNLLYLNYWVYIGVRVSHSKAFNHCFTSIMSILT